MSKVNISVEMSEEEYLEYKKMLEQKDNYMNVKEMSLYEFLRIKNFKQAGNNSIYDHYENRYINCITLESPDERIHMWIKEPSKGEADK